MAGWMVTRWWWSSSQTFRASGSTPQAVAVLSTAATSGTLKSLVRVVDAPTARLATVPTEPSLSSLTATLVRSTSPVLVTLKLYVTVSPTWDVAAPDFTIVMAGWMVTRWWWSSSQTWRASGSTPQAVAVLSTAATSGTLKSLVRVVDAPTARLATVPTEPSLSSLTATLVRSTSPVLVTLKL